MPDFDDFVASIGPRAEGREETLALLRDYNAWLMRETRRSAVQSAICALGEVAERWSREEDES